MRVETKLIKDILHKNFPNNQFKVQYKTTKDQITNGDRIIIATDANYQEVKTLLYKYTKCMVIGSINGMLDTDSTGGYIINDTGKYTETNAIFIMISNLLKGEYEQI